MYSQYWSWALTIVGVIGLYLVGKKIWWSWYINLGCQILWYAYAFATQQYGFVASATIYTIIFGYSAYTWTRDHYQEKYLKTIVHDEIANLLDKEDYIDDFDVDHNTCVITKEDERALKERQLLERKFRERINGTDQC